MKIYAAVCYPPELTIELFANNIGVKVAGILKEWWEDSMSDKTTGGLTFSSFFAPNNESLMLEQKEDNFVMGFVTLTEDIIQGGVMLAMFVAKDEGALTDLLATFETIHGDDLREGLATPMEYNIEGYATCAVIFKDGSKADYLKSEIDKIIINQRSKALLENIDINK